MITSYLRLNKVESLAKSPFFKLSSSLSNVEVVVGSSLNLISSFDLPDSSFDSNDLVTSLNEINFSVVVVVAGAVDEDGVGLFNSNLRSTIVDDVGWSITTRSLRFCPNVNNGFED